MRDAIESAAKSALSQFLSPSLLKSAASAICDELAKQLGGAAKKPGRPKKTSTDGATSSAGAEGAQSTSKATKGGGAVDKKKSFQKSAQWAKRRIAEGNPKPGDEEIAAAYAEGKVISVAAARARAEAAAGIEPAPKKKRGRPSKKDKAAAEAATASTDESSSAEVEEAVADDEAVPAEEPLTEETPINGVDEHGHRVESSPLAGAPM